MGRWECRRCFRRLESNKPKHNVRAASFWQHYQELEPYATRDDVICGKCHAEVRHAASIILPTPIPDITQSGESRHYQLRNRTVSSPDQFLVTHDIHQRSQDFSDGHEASDQGSQGSLPRTEDVLDNFQTAEASPCESQYSTSSNQVPTVTNVFSHQSSNEPDELFLTSQDNDTSQISSITFQHASLSSQDSFRSFEGFSQDSADDASSTSTPSSCSIQSSSVIACSNNRMKMKGMLSLKKTEKKCCLCDDPNGRTLIPETAIMQMWKQRHIRIPKRNRCCITHLVNGKFTDQAIQDTVAAARDAEMDATEALKWISDLTDLANKKPPLVDFDIDSGLTETDYTTLTGFSKANFEIIVENCKGIRNSTNRSKRNAVSMLLVQLRLNLSQNVLCLLYGVQNQSTMSETLDAVLIGLERSFIPKNIGFGHILRSEVIEKHSVPAFDKLLLSRVDDEEGAPLDSRRLQLVFDATYLFLQKPTDFELQRKTYSVQKLRNLVKPMMTVTTTGYIVDSSDLYFADSSNNDAAILQDMMKKTRMLDMFEFGDHAIVDRGFRDVVQMIEDYAVYTHMPELLPRTRKQFSTLEGNKSRKVTMIRWIVEAVNGRLKKKFKFFDANIQLSSLPKLGRLFKLGCALSNAFLPPIFTQTEFTEQIVEAATSKGESDNPLRLSLEHDGILTKRIRSKDWTLASHESVPEFPRLTEKDLKLITLGVYQLRKARFYTEQHTRDQPTFHIFVHRERETLIRAKLQSRFSRRHRYHVLVEFELNGSGPDSITGYYCECKTGDRTLGACAHVTTIIWFLGFARHHPEKTEKRRSLSATIMDAAEKLTEQEDNSASEDENEDEEVGMET